MKDFSTFSKSGYFGAANGFSGFRHNFNEIFQPEHFTKIFILKGGPGTGKSSFMQAYAEHFNKIASVEVILCSSDSNSLDAVIVEYKNAKFAVIDGTSPHDLEVKIPGAKDELVNLGENWDESALLTQTDEIIALNVNKKRHYKHAYEELHLAGVASDTALCMTRSCFDMDSAKKQAGILISGICGEHSQKNGFLLKAFNKNGLEEIPSFYRKPLFRIGGNYENCITFMQVLNSELLKKGCSVTRYQSPFTESITDAIETNDMIFAISESESEINCDSFARFSNLFSSERYNELLEIKKRALALAKSSFAQAAQAHESLEKIYKSAMEFDKNDKKLEEIIQRSEAIAKKQFKGMIN